MPPRWSRYLARGARHSITAPRKPVLRPASTEEVAAIVTICAEAGMPIVPQGGNTGLAGGAVPWEDGKASCSASRA